MSPFRRADPAVRAGWKGRGVLTTAASERRRRTAAAIGALALTALVASGCTPDQTRAEEPSQSSSAPAVLPCIVSEPDGQDPLVGLAYDGVRQAADELGVRYEESPAATMSAVGGALDHLVGQGCTVIVTAGDRALPATVASASAHPDVAYVWVDESGARDLSGYPELSGAANITPVLFDLTQPAFLAGYLAAGMTKTGVVGTFAETASPTSDAIMDAFAQGVEHYDQVNAEKLTKPVRVVGWDRTTRQGDALTGPNGRRTATHAVEALMQDEADIILPVRMPGRDGKTFYQQVADPLTSSKVAISVIGMGSDAFESAPDVSGTFLTSLVTAADVGVYGRVIASAKGALSSAPFIGTLGNGGVDLAPYHDWSDRVPENLTSALDLVETAVIGGGVIIDASIPR